jgi:hypothetical protein
MSKVKRQKSAIDFTLFTFDLQHLQPNENATAGNPETPRR